jgi:hypothetical protein
MSTTTIHPLNIAPKQKSKPVKSLNTILTEIQDPRGFYLWPDLMQQLETHYELTRLEAAIEIRSLVEQGQLFQVPSSQTASVCFSRKEIARPDVYWTSEDEKLLRKQNADYLAEISRTVQNQNQNKNQNKNKKQLRGLRK